MPSGMVDVVQSPPNGGLFFGLFVAARQVGLLSSWRPMEACQDGRENTKPVHFLETFLAAHMWATSKQL